MATNIFPGVYTTIRDESFYVQALPGAIGFICMYSEKGPDNVVRLTTSVQDLLSTYGKPEQAYYGQGWYIAHQYLGILGNLYICRVLPNDAEYANLCLRRNSVTGDPEAMFQNTLISKSSIDTHINTGTFDACFFPVGRGEWYNKVAIKLTPSATYTQFNSYHIDIYIEDTDTGVYLLNESFLISFNRAAKDLSNESLFAPDVLEKYSEILRCIVSDTINPTLDWGLPFSTYVTLNYGSDGNIYDPITGYIDWNLAQNQLALAYNGAIKNPMTDEYLSEITDTDCILFSVIFDAGYPDPVKNAIVNLCDTREDCFAFLDNGDNTRPASALTMRRTRHNYSNFRVGLFEEYTQIYDTYTGRYMWVTPIYHVAKAFAKTERDYDLWWPFAGLNRGVIDGIYDMRYKLVGGYKDEFKLSQLNPIMQWAHGGTAIWGNWTTLQRPSSLQNIHVVLTVLYIKRVLEWNLKYFIYELNDKYTWEVIKSEVSAFLGDLQTRRALEWFTVKVFATDYDKKNNRCQVVVDLKVTGAIEVLSITLAVH